MSPYRWQNAVVDGGELTGYGCLYEKIDHTG